MLSKALQGATSAAESLYVEDVFSTYLYTGNGSTQTINNGIDLAGEGGMTWIKSRSASTNHFLFDTSRGVLNEINSNTTESQASLANSLTAFNADGFALGSAAGINVNAETYASWTFREAEKFFDVVTYTGNSSSSRAISHNLNGTPGCVIVKSTDASGGRWAVWHRSTGNDKVLYLDLTQPVGSNTTKVRSATSTTFTVGNDFDVNLTGVSYVAYLFAHDAGGFGDAGTDNVISCGSYTGNGLADGPTVTLGYEPQWLLLKSAGGTDGWQMVDIMRGWTVNPGVVSSTKPLFPNTSAAEGGISGTFTPTATGFKVNAVGGLHNDNGITYIYIAIRRGPMKTPTSGTSVFAPDRPSSSGTFTVDAGFPIDFSIVKGPAAGNSEYVGQRLTGSYALDTTKTAAEYNLGWNFASNTSATIAGSGNYSTWISWNFRRAPGFFDVVCYTGTGVRSGSGTAQAVNVRHNLTVAPELWIIKSRSNGNAWIVGSSLSPSISQYMFLMATQGWDTLDFWDNTLPSATNVYLSSQASVNGLGLNFVGYLFATLAGVSKVGSYTGNGSSQTINCEFTAGARFILIKRTDDAGDWYVWDSARGIVAGNDPHLSLNTVAAEVTTDDSVDAEATGFIVNQVAATNINVSGGTYIFLAIA